MALFDHNINLLDHWNPQNNFFNWVAKSTSRFTIKLSLRHICISLLFSEFLCIFLHFSAFFCISLHFSSFLYIYLHFSCNSLHFFVFLCISLDSIAVSLFTIIAIITNIHHHSLSSLLFIIIHYYHYYSSSFTIITIIHHHSLLSLLFTIIIWRSVPLFYGRHFFSATGAVVWSGFCLQEPFQPNAACPAQLSILPDKQTNANANILVTLQSHSVPSGFCQRVFTASQTFTKVLLASWIG